VSASEPETAPAVPRVRVSRAPANPSRPPVQRLAQAEVPVTPVEPEAATTPSLLRRIFRRHAAPQPEAVPPITTAPPRAAVTRVVSPADPPRPRVDLQEAEAETPISETPAIRGTNPERLARMLGTDVELDAEGNPTVSMPRMVSRADNDTGNGSTHEPASTTPSTPANAPATEAAGVDLQAITDSVIETLRRELIIEREQAGGAMDLI